MRRAIFLVAAACAFGLAPFASKLGVLGGAALLLMLAVGLAAAASGGVYSLAVSAGALGAFTSGVLASASGAVAGACLVGLAFAERTIRVRGGTAKLVHVGVALLGGALAGTMSAAYASAPPVARCVSIAVSAVLVALPLLIDADDPVAHALDMAASQLQGAVAVSLRQGAELRRNVEDVPLDRETGRGVAHTWRALVRLTEARARLERGRGRARVAMHPPGGPQAPALPPSPADSVRNMIDQRIAEHVTALSRAYTAVDAAHAAELGLDDAAMRSVDAVGETLEDVSRAMVEVKSEAARG
jgi:hypothetical protein